MCGIAVIWDPNKNFTKLSDNLIKDLAHRGPDSERIVSLEDPKLFLAHSRLKIIDMSDEANQPFFSPCGRWILCIMVKFTIFKS